VAPIAIAPYSERRTNLANQDGLARKRAPKLRSRQTPRPRDAAAPSAALQVDAEVIVPLARVQVLRLQARRAFEHVYQDSRAHWIDMSLTNRAAGARASYRARWGPHRFEHLGALFMAPRGEALTLRGQGGDYPSIVCRLDAAAMTAFLQSEVEWTERRLEASLDIASTTIRGLLRKLAHEMRYPGLAARPLMELLAAEIAIEVARHFSGIDAPAAIGGLAPWRLHAIDERLAEAGKAPTIGELAALCSMSSRHLARAFRTSRGYSIGHHILQARIDVAKRLLASDDSITAIAHQLGFSSLSSFSFAFRRGVGVSPLQFRARALQRR
jgi:AraC family transcriptional regulator